MNPAQGRCCVRRELSVSCHSAAAAKALTRGEGCLGIVTSRKPEDLALRGFVLGASDPGTRAGQGYGSQRTRTPPALLVRSPQLPGPAGRTVPLHPQFDCSSSPHYAARSYASLHLSGRCDPRADCLPTGPRSGQLLARWCLRPLQRGRRSPTAGQLTSSLSWPWP